MTDTTTAPDAEYLTAAEAAALLGVHRNTIHNMVRDGRLQPAGKLPGTTGALLFHPAAVAARGKVAA